MLEGVQSVSLNLMTQTLSIETVESGALPRVLARTKEIVKQIEPEVTIQEKGNGTEEAEEVDTSWRKLIPIGIGGLLFLIGLLFYLPIRAEWFLFLTSYLLVGGRVVYRAVRSLLSGQLFDETFLMSTATIGAFLIGELPEGVAVMLFYQIGEYLQDMAVRRSRRSIQALLSLSADTANLIVGDSIREVPVGEVRIGDRILIRPGEKVPLDGRVISGSSSINTGALTGESLPKDVKVGDEVLSGSVNLHGLFTVVVTKTVQESTVTKILDMVQNAAAKKAKTEEFISRFARGYTPVVVAVALLIAFLPPLLIPDQYLYDWIYRALIFLVISCPCALVLSIPVGFFGGIGASSRQGILVKGGNYLEALSQVDCIAFDKTGTLTKGVFRIAEIRPHGEYTKEELLEYAAMAERYSNHPIALSIREAYHKEIDTSLITHYEERAGFGLIATIRGKKIIVGNLNLMRTEKILLPEEEHHYGTPVHIAIDGQYAGSLLISDELKDDAKKAIKGLKKLGIKKTAMLSGDQRGNAERVGKEIGIDEVRAELLPLQKVEALESLYTKNKGKVAYVGDGINDAPVLARADVGIAMGGVGTDAAIEAADVILMTDEPSKLITAIQIARKTKAIVWQNIILALGVKSLVLLMGAFGVATMWEAIFADVGVSLIAVLNALRILRHYKKSIMS